jgi:hypothetical protein
LPTADCYKLKRPQVRQARPGTTTVFAANERRQVEVTMSERTERKQIVVALAAIALLHFLLAAICTISWRNHQPAIAAPEPVAGPIGKLANWVEPPPARDEGLLVELEELTIRSYINEIVIVDEQLQYQGAQRLRKRKLSLEEVEEIIAGTTAAPGLGTAPNAPAKPD